MTGYGGGVFTGPVVAGDIPTTTIEDTTINAGTLPGGVTSHAVVGGAVAAVGNIFGATGTPAPAPAVLSMLRTTMNSTIASFGGGGLYNAGAANARGQLRRSARRLASSAAASR